jgi:hypothetical protein
MITGTILGKMRGGDFGEESRHLTVGLVSI